MIQFDDPKKAQSLLIDAEQFREVMKLPLATKPLPFGLHIIERDWMPPGTIMGIGSDGKPVFITGIEE